MNDKGFFFCFGSFCGVILACIVFTFSSPESSNCRSCVCNNVCNCGNIAQANNTCNCKDCPCDVEVEFILYDGEMIPAGKCKCGVRDLAPRFIPPKPPQKCCPLDGGVPKPC